MCERVAVVGVVVVLRRGKGNHRYTNACCGLCRDSEIGGPTQRVEGWVATSPADHIGVKDTC